MPALASGKVWGTLLSIGLVLYGAAFGVLTTYAVWPQGFPYADVLAPVDGITAQAAKLPWAFVEPALPWVARGLAALWFGIAGFALARIHRRWWLLLLMAALHAGGWFLVMRGG